MFGLSRQLTARSSELVAALTGLSPSIRVSVAAVAGAVVGFAINGLAGAGFGVVVGGLSAWLVSMQVGRAKTAGAISWRWEHTLAASVWFFSLILMRELDTLLTFMRTAGQPARDVSFLASSLDVDQVQAAVSEFETFDDSLTRTRDARAVIWLFVFIDSVFFVWAYGVLCARVLHHRCEKITELLPPGILENEEARRLRSARRFMVWAGAILPFLMAVDWLENLALGALVEQAWGGAPVSWLLRVLAVTTTVLFGIKWLMVLVIVGLMIVERFASRIRWFAVGDGTVLEAVSRLRPLVIVWLVLAAFMFQPLQVSDVLLRLGERGPPLYLAGLAAIWLAITVLAWASLLQRTAPVNRHTRFDDRGLLHYGLYWILGSVVLWLGFGWHWILVTPGAMAMVVGAAGRGLDARIQPRTSLAALGVKPSGQHAELPGLLAAAVPAVIGAAMIRAGFADSLFLQDPTEAQAAVVAGAGLIAIGLGVFLLDRLVGRYVLSLGPENGLAWVRGVARLTFGGSVAAFLACLIALLIDPVATGRSIGALALFLVLLAGLAGLAGWLTRWSDQIRPPTLFRQLNMQRIPVFAMLGVWLVLGQVFLDRSDHAIRSDIELTTPGDVLPSGCSEQPPVAPTIEQAWSWWLATNGLTDDYLTRVASDGTVDDEGEVDERDENDSERLGYPVILVAASGGGIRAAWWAAAVMGRLADEAGEACIGGPPQDFAARQIFAASGISGGSLGLAAHQGAVAGGTTIDPSMNWVDHPLGQDHLSPPLAWFTYVETPRSMLGFPFARDRAEVMENSWEEPWANSSLELGLRATWRAFPQLPLLAINGATVSDGCRVLLSVLNVDTDPSDCRPRDPATEAEMAEQRMDTTDDGSASSTKVERLPLAETYSMHNLVCPDRDLRLSTSALLSARFPLISPAGRMEGCDNGRTIEIVDGGYRDANGAETAYDLWQRIEPMIRSYNDDPTSNRCLVPMFVQIDDDFRLRAPVQISGRWPPLLAPAKAILEARGAQSTAGDFDIRSAIPSVDRITIEPTAAPGVHPSLGWSLSKTTRTKMKTQINAETNEETGGIRQLRSRTNQILNTPCEEPLG